MTSSLSTIFSSTLEIVAPIRLKKVREKTKAPWYNLECKWKQTNLEVLESECHVLVMIL